MPKLIMRFDDDFTIGELKAFGKRLNKFLDKDKIKPLIRELYVKGGK